MAENTTTSLIQGSKDWTFKWKSLQGQLSSRAPSLMVIHINPYVIEAAEAVASIGLITKEQLLSLYNIERHKRNHLCKYEILIYHEVFLTDQEGKRRKITVFTLGRNGAELANISNYKIDYWRKYYKSDVYKRIMFFAFYEKFIKNYPKTKIFPGIFPFAGSIKLDKTIMEVFIYSHEDDFYHMMNFIRWGTNFNRMILVAKDLNALHQLKPHLEKEQIRLLREDDILQKNNLKGAFYVLKDREFVLERTKKKRSN